MKSNQSAKTKPVTIKVSFLEQPQEENICNKLMQIYQKMAKKLRYWSVAWSSAVK